MTEETLIDRAGPDATDWQLVVTDGDVAMRRQVPYDGVLEYSTETRAYVSHRKSSRYNLSVEQVLDRYADATGRTVPPREVLA